MIYTMAATQGIYVLILTCFRLITIAQCRGANDLSDGETTSTTWPVPRSPKTANSSYIRSAPDAPLEGTYTDDTLPYLAFYRLYSRYAKLGGNKASNFTTTTEVCVNYQSYSNRSIGVFKCPFPHEPPEYTACCGREYLEYCCLPKHYIDSAAFSQSIGGVLFFVLMILVLLFGAIVWNLAAFKTRIKMLWRKRMEKQNTKT